ncbi:MAG: hypothetical protein WD877_02065 [Candidatus Saccharimonadales bacterium]
MSRICPAILAESPGLYRERLEKVASFARRIQIDLTDGHFAPTKTIDASEAWWPVGVKADFHLMYKNPMAATEEILKHQPHMIIVHAEADGDFENVASICKTKKVKVGIALLKQTSPKKILPVINEIDHVLVFSGSLGRYNGYADISLLSKVHFLKAHRKDLEVGWDGGINLQNISQLAIGGVDVFNVGGFIQNADDPEKTYHMLTRVVEETGTT